MTKFVRALAIVILAASQVLGAAERRWRSGLWRDSGDARTYVIVTESLRIHAEDIPPAETRALSVAAGTPVRFAVEGTRVFVLDRANAEHELRLLRTVDLR